MEVEGIDNLNFQIREASPIVTGKIELPFESYDVEIAFPEKYPYRYPIVREVSNRIPKGETTHKANDGTLCLEVPPKEIVICRDGISFSFFIEEVLKPHLAIQYIKKRTGKYPYDEYDHFVDGHFQYYRELLDVDDNKTVLKIIGGMANSFERSKKKPCICDSGKAYEDCHYDIVKDKFGLTIQELKSEYNRLRN